MTQTITAPSKIMHKLATLVGGIVVEAPLLYVVAAAHDSMGLPAKPVTYLVAFVGIAMGWLTGFIASPYDVAEADRFSKWTTAIAFFFTGYLLSKLEPSMHAVFDDGALLKIPEYGVRAAAFAFSFVVALIQMYAFRYYSRE